MPSIKRHCRRLGGFLLLSIAFLGCAPKSPPLTQSEKKHMHTLTADMNTRCVGRYLIDLPKSMTLNDQYRVVIEDVLVTITPTDSRQFAYQIDQRELNLRSMTLFGQDDVPFLKKIERLPELYTGIVFNRAESQGGADFGRTLELHGFKNGYYIRMDINATDSTDPKYQGHPRIRYYETDTDKKLQHLLNLFSRTRGRKDDEVPTTQGTCVPNGFISGPATDREDMGVAYELAEDVWLGFESDGRISGTTTLLDRAEDIEWGLKENEGRTVRKGSRKAMGGLKFDEWLSALRTNDHVMGHLFMLEANSKIGGAKSPLLNIDLHIGLRAPRPERPYDSPEPPAIEKASLSEAEAVALWDAITSTLRPRPGAF
jgi:hypothetical protein